MPQISLILFCKPNLKIRKAERGKLKGESSKGKAERRKLKGESSKGKAQRGKLKGESSKVTPVISNT